ncbi:TerD family protein [Anaerotruncus sp.]|jgi:tellurium resistance protein TerD|nr:TerD family protein [Anaerotruncus sp.]
MESEAINMAISLAKGQKINLSKADGSQLTNILIGLGWKEVQASGGLFGMFKQKVDVDIDASVLMLDAGGKIPSPEEVIFFNHKDHATGCIHHCGDNLVGGKMGGMDDSEQIQVDLTKVPQGIERIVFVVNIYDCVKRKQHFGMVENAYIRIVDQGSQETIASYNLTEDYSGKTSMIVGEIYHKDGAWKFNAVGQPGYDPGLSEIVAKYR